MGNKPNDEQADLIIHGGSEKNDAFTTIEQELHVDNIGQFDNKSTHKQTDTLMGGGSKNMEWQIITEGSSKDMEGQEAEVDILNGFYVAEFVKSKQASNNNNNADSEGVHMDDNVGNDEFSAHCNSLDSSINISRKNFRKLSSSSPNQSESKLQS